MATPSNTTTTLAVTAAGNPVTTVSAGTVVKLTATVSNLSTKVGLVKFCNATATYCTDVNLVGTAQVTSAGTAVFTFIPGNGNHSYKAIYVGTNTAPTSASGTSSLTVTPQILPPYATTTAIASSGNTGNYTLTGTVIGTASTTIPLTGSVTFPDTTNGNVSLGSATLGASKPGFNFTVNDYLEACGLNTGLVVADFNGDGIPDVASSCAGGPSSSTVQVYLGTGGGNMGTPVGYTVDGPNTGGYTNLAVADFNGDGIPDIVDIDGGYNEVSVLLGNGNGTFATQKKTSVGSQPLAVAVGDFNGDGIPDLAVTSNNDSKLYILIGKGDGTFTVQATSYPTGSNPTGIVAGDFNNDGKLDLAVSNNGTNTIQIFLGNGDGTFTQTATPLITGNQPATVIAADFNRDGKLDLATGNFADNTVAIFLGNGDGTFTASTIPTMPDGVTPIFDRNSSLSAADFNGDGIPDLAVVNYSYVNSAQNSSAILYGNGDGTFTFAGFATINNNSQGWPGQQDNPDLVVAADMNGDGIPDVVMVDSNYNVALTIDTITGFTETATATLNNVAPQGLGTHNVEASYPGDTNYTSSMSPTTALNGSATTKGTTTLTGPTVQPVQIPFGTTGSIPITVSTTGSNAPTGTVTFTIGSPCTSGCTGGATIISGVAMLPTPSNLPSSFYTMTVNYAGDTNNNAASPITVQFQPVQVTPTVTYPAQTAISYGTALTNTLNATTAYNSTNLTSGGTTTYTAAQGSGSPVAVTTATVLGTGTYTLTATWTPNSGNSATYKSATGTTTLVVNKSPLVVTANTISITYGQALPAYTATITGFVNGDTAATAVTGSAALSTTPTTPGAVNTYPITPAIGSLAATNYTFSTFTSGTLTIGKASSAASIAQTAPLPVTGGAGVGVPATFAVVIADASAGSTGTPTGTVQFFNGATAIGSPVTLVNGSASLTTTFTTVQTASVTALYSGDGNFNSSGSAPFPEAVVTPGFTVAANPTSMTITRGTPATGTLTFTPFGNYQGLVAYTCTGLPAYTSCLFTPGSVSFSGNNAVQTSTVTFYTIAPYAAPGTSRSAMLWIPAALLGMLLMVRRRKLGVATRSILMLLVLACAVMSMSGCGGGGSFVTPTGTDTVTVNVTALATPGTSSSNLNQTATISITVQ